MKTIVLLFALSLQACSKDEQSPANATTAGTMISLALVTHLKLTSNFGFVPCFPSEVFELNNSTLVYDRKMPDSCSLKSLNQAKNISSEQKQSLYENIESLILVDPVYRCPSDYATSVLSIYNGDAKTDYATVRCEQGQVIKYEDFEALKILFRKLAGVEV